MTATPTIDLVLDIFATTLKQAHGVVADVPDARMAEQPGGVVNHPAWTLSHLVVSAGYILSLLDEPMTAAEMESLKEFGPGSVPVTDRGVYASKEELLATLADRHARADAAVRAKHGTYFDRPSPEYLRGFSPTLGRVLVYLLAAHESYHLAQLMPWRRAAGIVAAKE